MLGDDGTELGLRSEGSGNHHFVYSISNDGGETWTVPLDQAQMITPVCMGSVISHKGPTDAAPALYYSSPYSSTNRANLTILASDDNGVTFSRSLRLWPGGAVEFYAVFDRDLHSRMPLVHTPARMNTPARLNTLARANVIPLGCSLLLPVYTVNCVQTLKVPDTLGWYGAVLLYYPARVVWFEGCMFIWLQCAWLQRAWLQCDWLQCAWLQCDWLQRAWFKASMHLKSDYQSSGAFQSFPHVYSNPNPNPNPNTNPNHFICGTMLQ
jgi:hypothetical protein